MRNSAGDEAEKKTVKELQKLGIDAQGTTVSGAVWNDGDIIAEDFMIDSKLQEYRGNKLVRNLTLKVNEFKKITKQAQAYFKRPAMVLHNGYGESYVVITLEDFAELIRKDEDVKEDR